MKISPEQYEIAKLRAVIEDLQDLVLDLQAKMPQTISNEEIVALGMDTGMVGEIDDRFFIHGHASMQDLIDFSHKLLRLETK